MRLPLHRLSHTVACVCLLYTAHLCRMFVGACISRGRQPWTPDVARSMRVVTERIPQRFGLHPMRAMQVLTPMSQGSLGARALNAVLSQTLNPEATSRVTRFGDVQSRQGVWHLRIEGKREKIRYIPLAIAAQRLITAYLAAAKHGDETDGPLFRPVKNNTTKTLAKALHKSSVWDMIRLYTTRIASPGPCRVLACMPCGRRPPQWPGAWRRYRQGAGVAGACGYLDDAALR